MTVNNDFLVNQTVFYNEYGFPVPWVNKAKEPQLRQDVNGYNIVVADKNGNPKVVIDNYGSLQVVISIPAAPTLMNNNSQYAPISNFTGQIPNASAEPVKHQNNLSKTVPVVNREDIYKKVRKLGVDSAKQLLFYESVLINDIRFFIDFDEEDTYNFLTDQIMLQSNPISRLDHLVSIKTYGSIPDSFLNWFSDDLRAGLYLLSFFKELKESQNHFYGETEFLNWLKSIIKITEIVISDQNFIRINVSTDQLIRRENIENLMIMRKMYLKDRINLRKISWLDEGNIEQVNWAYDYISNHKKIVFEDVFFSKTMKDKFNLILASIDSLDDIVENHTVPNGANTLTLTQRGLFIYKMRRAWDSVLSTRKKVEKKSERSITVNQNNFENLSKLSTLYKLTPTKMVNKLIEDEFSLIDGNSKK